MFKATTLIALLAAMLLLVGCNAAVADNAPNDGGLTIALDYPTPAAIGETTLLVTLTDAGGAPVLDATVNVRGDMTHAGMQPVFGEASAGEAGVYSVPFEWTMGGDWVVTITAEAASGATSEQSFDLTVDGEMSTMEMGN
ncbi:MAG: FixH family protein [Chloroflexales bacterium]|nr:FixH family protein [Chloroflexales bacterium]